MHRAGLLAITAVISVKEAATKSERRQLTRSRYMESML